MKNFLIEKPQFETHLDYQKLITWLQVIRPGAATFIKKMATERINNKLFVIEFEDMFEDMQNFPNAYINVGYTCEDIAWLHKEFDNVKILLIHFWY